jgi:hypothetical protein
LRWPNARSTLRYMKRKLLSKGWQGKRSLMLIYPRLRNSNGKLIRGGRKYASYRNKRRQVIYAHRRNAHS